MRASQFFISTLKEAPADADVVSHKLMMRAGMIKRIGAGIYNYMPMGLRVIRKVEAIVREEMNRAGAVELLMPMMQPAELWKESGRFETMGPELLRVKDRHDHDFIIQPTSEEVVTDIARQELKSYRSLPKNFYHIQTKFRDERRPRFGIMRGREFTMKDAYSFDRNVQAAGESYERMYAAYEKIFGRLGLRYRAVLADTGAIGGERSHEFQVIAETGEDVIAYSTGSSFAANIELAEALPLLNQQLLPTLPLAKVPTPGKCTCEDVAALLGVPLTQTVKSLVLAADELDAQGQRVGTNLYLLLVRGDHSLNETKAAKLVGLSKGFRFASATEISENFNSPPGYLGPIGLVRPVKIVADRTVALMSDFVCGANEQGFHFSGVNWGRDLPEPDQVADIRNVMEGDLSPDRLGRLVIQRGIEVGHIFYLGRKYSQAMNATFLDEGGRAQFFEMGCYGIGVTRIVAAAIEQNHDARGMIWPVSMAPFAVVLCPIGLDRSDLVKTMADSIYADLQAQGVDVLLDDRGERPGAMFADWELIGVPHRLVISDRGLKDGLVEYQGRQDAGSTSLSCVDVVRHLLKVLSPTPS